MAGHKKVFYFMIGGRWIYQNKKKRMRFYSYGAVLKKRSRFGAKSRAPNFSPIFLSPGYALPVFG